jgi:hypothetical protein
MASGETCFPLLGGMKMLGDWNFQRKNADLK